MYLMILLIGEVLGMMLLKFWSLIMRFILRNIVILINLVFFIVLLIFDVVFNLHHSVFSFSIRLLCYLVDINLARTRRSTSLTILVLVTLIFFTWFVLISLRNWRFLNYLMALEIWIIGGYLKRLNLDLVAVIVNVVEVIWLYVALREIWALSGLRSCVSSCI